MQSKEALPACRLRNSTAIYYVESPTYLSRYGGSCREAASQCLLVGAAIAGTDQLPNEAGCVGPAVQSQLGCSGKYQQGNTSRYLALGISTCHAMLAPVLFSPDRQGLVR